MGSRVAWAGSTLLLLVALATTASAAPFEPEGTDWEGLAELVALAQGETSRDRVVIPKGLDLAELGPTDALLIVHPVTHLDVRAIEAFIRGGGRVALLDDYGTGSELLEHFGIQRIALPSSPARRLRSNPALALAERPVDPPSLPDALRALREAGPTVTNHATGLTDTGLLPLLVVPGRGEPDVLLAVAGEFGRGRLLAVGDASIAINSMLRYPGNRALALSIVRYLSEERAPSPGRLYILANERALTAEHATQPSTSRTVGSLVGERPAALEQASPTVTYLVAVAVGLGVVLWASARAGRTHKASLPRFARPTPVAAMGGLAGHAASLAKGSPRRALGDLGIAIEELLGNRLGLERRVGRRELVARARAKGIVGESDAEDLERLLERLAQLQRPRRLRRPWERLGAWELPALARRSHRLLAAMDAASA